MDKRSQREIADVAGVADVTIRLKERVPLFVCCCTRQNLCVFFGLIVTLTISDTLLLQAKLQADVTAGQ